MFNDFGVEVITGVEGKDVEKVIDQAANGEVSSGENSCSPGGGKGTAKKVKTNTDKLKTERDSQPLRPMS